MLHLSIKKEPGSSLIKQIYEQIRNMILKGELAAGEKLPSTREMSKTLNVSRNTVMTAYEMLIAEGYVTGVPGSGIFAAKGAEFAKSPENITDYSVTAFTSQEISTHIIGFHSGTPALDLFPRNKWNRIASRVFKEAPASAFGYDHPEGRPELRNILAAYLLGYARLSRTQIEEGLSRLKKALIGVA